MSRTGTFIARSKSAKYACRSLRLARGRSIIHSVDQAVTGLRSKMGTVPLAFKVLKLFPGNGSLGECSIVYCYLWLRSRPTMLR